MKPLALGLTIAAVIIAAFFGGMFLMEEAETDGPAEQLGEAIDDAANQ